MASPAIQTRPAAVLTSPTHRIHHSRKPCPDCGSYQLCKSQRQGVLERFILRALKIRPYRCIICYGRFYFREAQMPQAASKTV